MNKRGVTILELLISISMISIVILLLIKVMFSLEQINNNSNYASQDEIARTEIMKLMEDDFLALKLNGIAFEREQIQFYYGEASKTLILENDKIIYDGTTYSLNSKNASYSSCVNYSYLELDDDYYFIKLTIPVLISGENTTIHDDITLTYLGLKNEFSQFPTEYVCS